MKEGLYEVIFIPHDAKLRQDLESRFLTYAPNPDRALETVIRHLEAKNHVACLIREADFMVHARSVLSPCA